MTSPLLEVDALRVEFPARGGPLAAVDGVSFSIGRGEVLGMVGESGAGKSMVGNAVIGLVDPPGRIAGGAIRLAGRRIDDLPGEELRRLRGRRIGAVFQDPSTSLNPLYSIGHQLTETILAHIDIDAAAARERTLELLDEVGLPPAAENGYPHQFSGGMRQRVVVALALCAGPDLVIADEPTTALDVSTQAQIIRLLKRLCADRGAGVLLITHDMGVIAEIADRVAVMYAGRVVEIGPVRDVVRTPGHPYTCGLMAAIPAVGRDVDSLVQIEGSMPGLHEIPSGCAFHPRCPEAVEICGRAPPGATPVGASKVACWLRGEPPDRGQRRA